MIRKLIEIFNKYWWILILVITIFWLLYFFTNCRYWPNGNCTGFHGKTLWDVLELLIIPITLAIVASYLEKLERQTDREIALDNQREAALQKYFDVISDLVINQNLNKLDLYDNDNYNLINISLNRTYATLRLLDSKRKGILVNFLSNLELIHSRFEEGPILFLDNCDFQNVFLVNINFNHAHLHNTNFSYANVSDTNFQNALLNNSDFSFAKIINADFSNADLSGCNFHHANIASSTNFSNTIMPDGIIFNPDIHKIIELTNKT